MEETEKERENFIDPYKNYDLLSYIDSLHFEGSYLNQGEKLSAAFLVRSFHVRVISDKHKRAHTHTMAVTQWNQAYIFSQSCLRNLY